MRKGHGSRGGPRRGEQEIRIEAPGFARAALPPPVDDHHSPAAFIRRQVYDHVGGACLHETSPGQLRVRSQPAQRCEIAGISDGNAAAEAVHQPMPVKTPSRTYIGHPTASRLSGTRRRPSSGGAAAWRGRPAGSRRTCTRGRAASDVGRPGRQRLDQGDRGGARFGDEERGARDRDGRRRPATSRTAASSASAIRTIPWKTRPSPSCRARRECRPRAKTPVGGVVSAHIGGERMELVQSACGKPGTCRAPTGRTSRGTPGCSRARGWV